jgi:hypothetical protein
MRDEIKTHAKRTIRPGEPVVLDEFDPTAQKYHLTVDDRKSLYDRPNGGSCYGRAVGGGNVVLPARTPVIITSQKTDLSQLDEEFPVMVEFLNPRYLSELSEDCKALLRRCMFVPVTESLIPAQVRAEFDAATARSAQERFDAMYGGEGGL